MIFAVPQIMLFIFFLLCSACFSAAETSLFSLNKIHMGRIKREGQKQGEKVLFLLRSPQRLLSTILLGNTLVNIAATSVFTAFLVYYAGRKWGGLASLLVMPAILLVLGEITPKLIAVRNPKIVSEKLSGLIKGFMAATKPIRYVVDLITGFYLNIFGIKKARQDMVITESEFASLIDMSEKKGLVEEDEKEMITNLIDCSDIDVGEILTPRVDMVSLDIQFSRQEVMNIIEEEKYKHYPVHRETVDNVIGVVQAKMIFLNPEKELHDMISPPYFVPETKKIDELLKEMQAREQHVALVVDEHGGIEGIVSIIDIVEEIIGYLHDEYDRAEELIKTVDEENVVVKGSLRIEHANEYLDAGLPEDDEDFDTLAGFLLKKMGKIPRKGESIEHRGRLYVIKRASRRRIVSVMIKAKDKRN